MLAIVSIAAGAAVSSNGFGVLYGPGAGGFNGVGLHEGAQVGGAAYYWQPKPASDLMGVGKTTHVKDARGCEGPYMGNGCALRVCPYGLSPNTSPFIKNGQTGLTSKDDYFYAPTSRMEECEIVSGACDNDIFRGDTDRFLGTHTYVECSGKGACNRETGMCECFPGFTGVGCRYTTCPNDCSGHGLCKQNAFANTDYNTEGSTLYGSQFWDAYSTMRCVCDRGYDGFDCSERICPHGDDILTTCLSGEVADVQTIQLDFAAAISTVEESSRFFTLSFVDGFKGQYVTSPIQIMEDAAATAAETQIALEALPNHALPSVQVSGSTYGTHGQALAVTFSDPGTPGMQNDLGCSIRYSDEVCANGGQQPLIDSEVTTADFTCANGGHAETEPEMFEENVECGNRGICDHSTGKCECFEGHSGEACQVASVYV